MNVLVITSSLYIQGEMEKEIEQMKEERKTKEEELVSTNENAVNMLKVNKKDLVEKICKSDIKVGYNLK